MTTLIAILIGLAVAAITVLIARPATGVGRLTALFFGLGLAARLVFALATPAYQAPDERAHCQYVHYLAEHGELPVQTARTGDASNDWEYYQPPLYYALQVPVYRLGRALGGDDRGGLTAMRLASILLWLITVWAARRFLERYRVTDGLVRCAVMGLVCLLPTYVFLSSVVNNDNLVITLGALLLLLLPRERGTPVTALAIGFLLGAALLTKLSAVVYCPLIVVWLLRPAFLDRSRWRQAVLHLGLVVAVSALLWIPMALRNLEVYGSITAEHVANVPYEWPSLGKAIRSSLRRFPKTFWVSAGIYGEIKFLYTIGQALLALGLGGLVWSRLSRRPRPAVLDPGPDRSFHLAVGLAILVNLVLALRFGVLYRQQQGRFLYPLLLPIALYLGAGWRMFPLRRPELWLGGILTFHLAAFQAYALATFSG